MSKEQDTLAVSIFNHVATGICAKPSTFEPHVVCLAQYSGEYYRAEIIKPCEHDPSKVQVFFSDFGNIEELAKDQTLEIPPELAKLPRSICHCLWDAAIAKQMDEAKLAEVFADERLAVTPKIEVRNFVCFKWSSVSGRRGRISFLNFVFKQQIAPGQYLVQLGQYSCNADFDIIRSEVAVDVKTVTGGVATTKVEPTASTSAPVLQPAPTEASVPVPTPVLKQVRAELPEVSSPVPTPIPVRQPAPVKPIEVPRPTPTPAPVKPIEVPRPPPTPAPVQQTPTPATVVTVPAPISLPSPVVPPVTPSPTSSSAGKYTLGGRPPLPSAAGSNPSTLPSPPSPSRKKYMLEQLAHSHRIRPNGEVFIAFTWSQTRYLVVGDDHDAEGPKIQGLIARDIQSCKLPFIFTIQIPTFLFKSKIKI